MDDGPTNWDDAVAQCLMAADEGIETIIATPHVLRGPWRNDSRKELQKLVLELNRRLEGRPRIILGCEYFFAHDVLEILDSDRGIVPLAGGRSILVEFASMAVPPRVDAIFYEMKIRGWSPIIAHPERNYVFQQNPEALRTLIERGARVQLTASSVEGAFGPAARKAAIRLLDSEMVHFIATDAHNLKRRPPRVREPFAVIADRWGEPRAQALFVDNPGAVLEQKPLPYDPEPHEVTRTSGLRSLFRRFWRVE